MCPSEPPIPPSSGNPEEDPTFLSPLSPSDPSSPGRHSDLAPGTDIGGFRIVKIIGTGGMGTVYEAEQQNPRRRVALKVIRGGSSVEEAELRMFAREIESLARLKHPNIATIHSSGRTTDGRHYFAMELVTGETLDEHLRRTAETGSLSPEEIERRLRLFITLCGAVNYAHQRGVIHRDLKPGNVMVGSETDSSHDGSSSGSRATALKVLDFGLARITDSDVKVTKLTEVATIMGTLNYMSPEQATGRVGDIDFRSDVYSLGVMLYESLTGKRPLDISGVPFVEALRKLSSEKHQPVAGSWRGRRPLDIDLATIIDKALAKIPGERYQSALALGEDLERYLTGQPILARPASGWYQMKKLAARHRVEVAAASIGFLLLIGFSVNTMLQARRITTERDRAAAEAARANAVNRFLNEVLVAAQPWEGGGRDVTIREALTGAARRIDESFRNQPLLRAEAAGAIAGTELGLGRLDVADSLNQVALDIRRNILRQSGMPLAASLYQSGMIARDKGEGERADSLYRAALEEVRKDRQLSASAVDSIEVDILTRLALNLNWIGRYAEAESVALGLTGMAVRRFGLESEPMAGILGVRADIAANTGRTAEQDSLLALEHRIHETLLGPKHPETILCLNDIAMNRMSQGNLAAAESLLRIVIADIKEVLGPDHPQHASSLENLANVYYQLNRLDETILALTEVIDIRRRGLGPESIYVYRTIANLGAVYGKTGPPEEAIRYTTEALGGFEKTMGPDHPEIAVMLSGRAAALQLTGDLDGAERDLRRALAVRRAALPDDSIYLATSRIHLGALLVARHQYAEAESLLTRGLEVRESRSGAADVFVVKAKKALEEMGGRSTP